MRQYRVVCYHVGAYPLGSFFFFFNDTATTEIYTLSLHDALPISFRGLPSARKGPSLLHLVVTLSLPHRPDECEDDLRHFRSALRLDVTKNSTPHAPSQPR